MYIIQQTKPKRGYFMKNVERKKKEKGILGAALAAAGTLAMSVDKVFASSASAFDTFKNAGTGNNVFGGATESVAEIGQSGINLLMVVGVIVAVIGLVLCGCSMVMFKGEVEVSKNKKHLLVILGAICIIFGAVSIVGATSKIGSNLGDSLNTDSTVSGGESTQTTTD
jgi:uncharacterized membrane protein